MPLLGFFGDKPVEIGRRTDERGHDKFSEACLDPWVRERGINFFVELIDDLNRRVLGSTNCGPPVCLKARQKLSP